uniref:RING-type domain-containing protein n=1 Tax=Astyanax mexicanus TaxID=7994 RepID=A0A8B9JA24_ASTMX
LDISTLEQQIQCSVCLGGFTDPVILPCEHLFCRQCILKHLQKNKNPFREARCPDCRNTFRQEDLRDNRPVRNIVETALSLGDKCLFFLTTGLSMC